MGYSQQLTNNISVVRIVFEFYPHLGGSITLTETLSQKIDCHLKNQLIIAPDFGGDHTNYDKQFKVPIIRIKVNERKSFFPVLPLIHLLYMVRVYFKIKELNKKYNFNIIHTHGIDITGFGTIIGKLLDIPVVGAVDGSMKAYSKLQGFYETIIARLFKPEYLIVGDDGPTTTETFKKILKYRAIVVFIGIDTDLFKPMEKSKQLLGKLGLNESDFIILSTSSLNHVKRIDLAIESFIRLLSISLKKDIYLLIAGHGALRNCLIELAKKSPLKNNIKFLGGVPADIIPDYLSIADVVIGTSLYSNMNVSVQEAMACSIPVVAFDSGGTSKTINHMNNGLLAKPGDIDDFAKKLKLLYDNPTLRRELGQNARKTIVEGRSWEIRIKKELEIYEKVLFKKSNK
jgi:L-malate glycosyltransferase